MRISILLLACNGIGAINQVIPRIPNMLNTLLPTMFPMAISFCFLRAATTEVASSGRLVPTATIVSPITASDSPIFFASSTAPSTMNFPPNTSQTRPMIIKIIDLRKLIAPPASSLFSPVSSSSLEIP